MTASEGLSIPVYLVGRAGTPNADNPLCTPCIMVDLIGPYGTAKDCLAMLDSGAFPNGFDDGVARRLGLIVVGKDILSSVNTVTPSVVCDAKLAIAGLPVLKVQGQVMNMRATGHPCDLILGRTFLTMFDFGFDYARQRWYLARPASEGSPHPSEQAPTEAGQ